MIRLFVLLAAVPPLIAAAPPSDQFAVASAAPFIDRANDDWSRAIVSGDADVLSAPYAENGIMIAPDGSVSVGKAAVRALYADRHKSAAKIITATIRSDGRVAPDADDVYEWGAATITLRRGNQTSHRVGRYLTVWHRAGDKWLISRNIAF